MKKHLKPLIFYIIFFLFILAFSTTAGNYDYDLWARLIVGKAVIQTGYMPKQDFLSYTPTHMWFDHEWGSGVVFYLVHHFFSSAGFLFLQAILIFLTFFFITKIIELRGTKTTTAYNFLFYYFAFMSMSYILNAPVRCQLFSFLFFTVFIYIIERFRMGKSKIQELIIYPPIIMIFWYNLHGGCVTGPGLVLIYIIGEFLNRKSIKEILPYIYSLIACIIVFPINPWGFEFAKLVIQSNSVTHQMISDWSGLFNKSTPWLCTRFKFFTLIMLLAGFVSIIKQLISKNFNFDKTKYLIIAATLFLAAQHLKLIPLAVISMTCFLYDDFYTVFNQLTRNFFNKIATIKEVLVYGLILMSIFMNIKLNGFGPYINYLRYPVKAVEFIKINKLDGNLLADLSFGSYISYKLYPHNKIFMDGRYEEVYNVEMLPILANFHLAGKDWENLLEIFPTDVVLLGKSYPIYSRLQKNKKWHQIFEDEGFGVFVKSNGFRKYINPPDDITYYKKTLFDTDIKFGAKNERQN